MAQTPGVQPGGQTPGIDGFTPLPPESRFITKPGRWAVVPSLTKYPYLWYRCCFAMPFWEQTQYTTNRARPYDLVTGQKSNGPTGAYPNNGWNITPHGIAFESINNGKSWPTLNFNIRPSWEDTRAVSLMTVGKATGGFSNASLAEARDANNQRIVRMFFQNSSSFRAAGGDNKYIASAGIETVGAEDFVVGISIFKENESVEVYYKNLSTGEVKNRIDVTGSPPDKAFDYELSSVRSVRNNALFNVVWTRELSSGEVQTLLDEPFAMLTPDPMYGVPIGPFGVLGQQFPVEAPDDYMAVINRLSALGLSSQHINNMLFEHLTNLGYLQPTLTDKLYAYQEVNGFGSFAAVINAVSRSS